MRAVLTGQVRQRGETLAIQVDLVDAATGAQLWGKEYERRGSEVLSVKQAIADCCCPSVRDTGQAQPGSQEEGARSSSPAADHVVKELCGGCQGVASTAGLRTVFSGGSVIVRARNWCQREPCRERPLWRSAYGRPM